MNNILGGKNYCQKCGGYHTSLGCLDPDSASVMIDATTEKLDELFLEIPARRIEGADSLLIEIKGLTEENAALKNKIRDWEGAFRTWMEKTVPIDNVNLGKMIKKLEQDLESLTLDNQKLNTENVELKVENFSLSREIQKLKLNQHRPNCKSLRPGGDIEEDEQDCDCRGNL